MTSKATPPTAQLKEPKKRLESMQTKYEMSLERSANLSIENKQLQKAKDTVEEQRHQLLEIVLSLLMRHVDEPDIIKIARDVDQKVGLGIADSTYQKNDTGASELNTHMILAQSQTKIEHILAAKDLNQSHVTNRNGNTQNQVTAALPTKSMKPEASPQAGQKGHMYKCSKKRARDNTRWIRYRRKKQSQSQTQSHQ